MNQSSSPFRNWIGLIGLVVGVGSFFSFLLLLLIDFFAGTHNPYLGILTFVVAPGFLAGGMVLILVGWLLQRRQNIKGVAGSSMPFLTIDLTRPQDRRNLVVFGIGSAVFLFCAAVGSYHSYHFAESEYFCGQLCHTPMRPEHTTYLHSPHAQVACTACHVGPGATSFVKAKLNGINQLQATIRNTFDRPINTPHNLRPAQEICVQCHWPKKYIGNVEKNYTHFLTDETNTVASFRLLLKVGGGDPTHGPVGGIHWHMNLGNKIEYIATNNNKQVIPWVRLTDASSNETVFAAKDFKYDPSKHQLRTMDCMDCHNRPAHQFQSPSDAVDLAMAVGRVDPGMILIKSNLVAVLSNTNYTAEPIALETIATTLNKLYPKDGRVKAAIAEAQQIYKDNFFPDMRADWRSYPDNKGHKTWPGCFRCHDGLHKTEDGKRKIEASNCNDCHIVLAQGSGAELKKLNADGLVFAHPDASSTGTDADCNSCHSPN
jgi:hypothetical protein